jgi:hypothetical protein
LLLNIEIFDSRASSKFIRKSLSARGSLSSVSYVCELRRPFSRYRLRVLG